jgi:threonine-phosphate decarboxylase
MIHGHGNDGYRLGCAVRADFSSNVLPGGPHPALRERLVRALDEIGSYPDAGAESFVLALAAHEGVPALNVGATSGAVAAIHLLAQSLRGKRHAIAVPAFSEYEDAVRLQGCEPNFFFADELVGGAIPEADVVWLANPNNPTGTVVAREALLGIVDARPETLFVVDLAYAGLCAAESLRPADAVARHNLVLVLSYTKQFAIPGLRLGAVIGPEQLVGDVVARSGPWAVNTLALAAGRFLLGEQRCDDEPRRLGCLAEALRLQAALGELSGLSVRPSPTNYFLLHTGRSTGAELREHLLREHGLLVRDAANFRGLDAHWVRIAAQTPRENAWLEEAMKSWARHN